MFIPKRRAGPPGGPPWRPFFRCFKKSSERSQKASKLIPVDSLNSEKYSTYLQKCHRTRRSDSRAILRGTLLSKSWESAGGQLRIIWPIAGTDFLNTSKKPSKSLQKASRSIPIASLNSEKHSTYLQKCHRTRRSDSRAILGDAVLSKSWVTKI